MAIAIAIVPGRSLAQDGPLAEYVAPEECPSRETVAATLESMLPRIPTDGAAPVVTASVTITSSDGAFDSEIVIREEGHETRRRLRDASCRVLAEGTAVVIAMALVPGLEVAAAAPTASPATTTDDTDTTTAAEPPASTAGIGGALRLAAHGSLGALPGVVIGGEIAGAIRIDALRIELAARGVPLLGARFAVDPSLGGDLGIAVGLVRAMGVLVVDPRFELLGGGGVEVGAALGRAVGISDPRDAASPWVALEAAIGLAWVPWPVIALVLEVEAMVPLVRPVFTVTGIGVLYRPEPVAGGLRIGLEFRFP